MLPTSPIHNPHLDLWRLNLDDPAPLPRLAAYLSAAEQARAAQFYFERDRHRYVVGRGMVRTILATYLEINPAEVPLGYGTYGKPYLTTPPTPPLYFNLSHSNGVGVLGVTGIGEIGVDIEYCRDVADMAAMAQLVFSSWEYARWNALPAMQRLSGFYRGWTCKEAYMKAVGMGFSLTSSSFDVAFLPDETTRLVSNDPHWTLANFEMEPTLMGAYALATPDLPIEITVRHREP